MEYLVTMTACVPAGTPEAAVDDIRAREARRSAELARAGQLLRLWRPPLQPGEWRTLGLFSAPDDGALEHALASIPLRICAATRPCGSRSIRMIRGQQGPFRSGSRAASS